MQELMKHLTAARDLLRTQLQSVEATIASLSSGTVATERARPARVRSRRRKGEPATKTSEKLSQAAKQRWARVKAAGGKHL
jgi:hypothetical protein